MLGQGIYVSDPYVIDDILYMSISEYSDADGDIADARLLCSINLNELSKASSAVTLTSEELVNGAKQLVAAGGKYLVFLPYSEMKYTPPYDTGYVIYNTENGGFYYKDTSDSVSSCTIDGCYMYYNTGHGEASESRRYDFVTGEDCAYTGENNTLNSSADDIPELDGEQYVKYETDKYWYAGETAVDFYGDEYFQINKNSLEKKLVAICRYPG